MKLCWQFYVYQHEVFDAIVHFQIKTYCVLNVGDLFALVNSTKLRSNYMLTEIANEGFIEDVGF